jgi:hypothetical protein
VVDEAAAGDAAADDRDARVADHRLAAPLSLGFGMLRGGPAGGRLA